MSFTSDIKREIISRRVGAKSAHSALSAFVRTSGQLGVVNGEPNFFLVSETEYVAEYFTGLFAEIFATELAVTNVSMDKKRGKDKLVLQCLPAYTGRVLARLGLLDKEEKNLREGIASAIIKTEEDKLAYVAGAFLGGGSCALPTANNGGYHLEIVFSERKTARDFCRLLDRFAFIANAKLTERKDTFVVYIKSKEAISDFLAILGLENSLRKFVAVLDKRDEANRDNRAKNCMAGNADKSAIASVKQVLAIEKLKKSEVFGELSVELKTLANARLANNAMTMKEVAEYLGVSKSCLNHRIRKLLELAEKTEEE